MKTENFSEYAGFRNGVEAIPARSSSKDIMWTMIPVNRKKNVNSDLFFGFKIAALEFSKAIRLYQ